MPRRTPQSNIQLPIQVPVNIVSADSFQDESGKYWIGSPEPKLYFARILRSKTVMLRVGGEAASTFCYPRYRAALTLDECCRRLARAGKFSFHTL